VENLRPCPWKSVRLLLVLLLTLGFAAASEWPVRAGAAVERVPTATLVETSTLHLPGEVDSNSPALWSLVQGRPLLHVITSWGGQPSVSSGQRLTRLPESREVSFVSHPGHGLWMESVIADAAGVWYGYYHNEIPAEVCGRPDRALPRIGAARSTDRGATWEDLGIVLEAPPTGLACGTANLYFVGGVGDLSAILDAESTYLYVFFSQYSRGAASQGIAVGRLPWAHRDDPQGRIDVWSGGAWLPARKLVDRRSGRELSADVVWQYPAGTPLVAPSRPWHDADRVTNAFWGAAVHWNTHLEQYVMLLNRTKDEAWTQDGIYVAFSPSIEDPAEWSAPRRLLPGGDWYPQVIGVEIGTGTDKLAGARARFFMGGTSKYLIEFAYR
jgi:hypothetical protein